MAKMTPLAWLEAAAVRAVSFLLGLLWKPLDLADCQLWLRPSRGVVRSGALVTGWQDQSGNHTVTASSIEEGAHFVAESTAFHGRPAVHFDGVGDLLQKDGPSALPFESEPFSAFLVLRQGAAGIAAGTPLAWGGEVPHVGIRVDSSNVFHAYLENTFSSGVTLLTGRPYLIGIVYAEEKLSLYVNGVPVKTYTGVQMWQKNPGLGSRLRVGAEAPGSNHFHGELGDVVLYGRALEEREVHKLSVELIAHYGIVNGKPGSFVEALRALVLGVRDAFERRGILRPRD